MRSLIAFLAISASLLQLVTAESYGTSVTTDESCITKVSQTTAAPSPVPTTTSTGDVETMTVIITVTVPEAVTTRNAVTTKTNYNTITIRSANATVTGGTATVINNAQTTVDTMYMNTITVSTTSCTGETVSTVTVPSTTTVYGNANSTSYRKQKRNPNPFKTPLLRPRQTAASSGSASVAAGTNLPVAVVCTQQPITYLLLTATISSGTSTVTGSSTSTSILNLYATRTIYYTTTSSALTTVTVTHTLTANAVATSTSTVETQCALSTVTGTAVQTVTRASQCAPAAMTSAAGSYDIVEIDDHPMGGAHGITTAEDPSTCCQLCVDTDECAAAAHLPQSGSCRLEFTSPSACGTGLYALQGNSEEGNQGPPGAGWWVQNGCGKAQIYI